MGTERTFETIRKGVAEYRDKGHDVVGIEALLKYLDSLEEELGGDDEVDVSKETEIERIRATFANQQLEFVWKKDFELAEHLWRKDSSLEMFKSVIAAGQNSMRAAMLMHGGASVALLAFIGNLAVNADTLPLVPSFGGILPWYLGGLLLVVVAYGTTYLTQNYYSEDDKEHVGKRWNILSCVLVIVSYLTFIAGSWLGYQALVAMYVEPSPEVVRPSEEAAAVEVQGVTFQLSDDASKVKVPETGTAASGITPDRLKVGDEEVEAIGGSGDE